MEIRLRLTPKEIEEAIKSHLTAKGYSVAEVWFNIDPGCPGSSDPREPRGPTLTHAECRVSVREVKP